MAWARLALILAGVLVLCGAAQNTGLPTPIADQPIKLSPVQPMDGKDAGGLGGLHKVEFVYPASVISAPPAQPAGEVLASGEFGYFRKYGLAILPGTINGGRATVRFYFYAGYTHQFACYVGLPSSIKAAPASFRVKVVPTADGLFPIELSGVAMANAASIDGGAQPKIDGLVRVTWNVAPIAKPVTAAIVISQAESTNWAFHLCTVARKKA